VTRLVFSALLLGCAAARAQAGDLVMLAPVDQAMPIVRFQDGRLAGGIVKDVGDAIAQRLGRRAVYLNAEVPEVKPMLSSGRADAMCYVLPSWIDGDYYWSSPLIPDAEMVVARTGSAPVHSLRDLRDRPVSTVAGYRYQRVEQVLGVHFIRTDAESIEKALQQLTDGQVQYSIVAENLLAYMQRNHPDLKVRPDLVFSAFKAQCAMSRKSQVPFTEFNRAIDAMLSDGTVDQILARYR